MFNVKTTAAQNNNLYLPPTEPGYDYPKPGGPSGPPSGPSPQRPTTQPKPDEVNYTEAN